MRQVADALGVQQASLYGHVSGKEEILELLRRRLHEEMAVRVDLAAHWSEAFREVAVAHRALLLRYPWLLEAIAESPASLDPAVTTVENLAFALERAGFEGNDIYHALGLLDVLVIGSAVDALAPEELYPASVLEQTASLRDAANAALGQGPRAEAVFRYALDLVVGALESRRLAAVASQKAER
jgi:AcrR family transcriptional regulator